jgi:cytochrome c-type biogenesis protein CcmH/NrfG
MLSQAEPFNLPESSIGDLGLKNCFELLLMVLLVTPLFGFGPKDQNATLESLLATAQQAQAGSDYAAAAHAYKQAVKIRPDVPELWANLGLMEHETANYADAIQSFQHAYQLKPSLYVPNLFLGIDLTHTGKAKEALPFLLSAEKINDADSQPHLALGRAYSSLQEFSLAAHEFANVTRLDPKQSTKWFSLGIAYLDQVETDARKMSEEGRASPYAKALFAEALATQSRYFEAVDLYKSILASSSQPRVCMGTRLRLSEET